MNFAIMLDSDDRVNCNASCGLFNNFCKVKMLDQSISFVPVVADKQVKEMVGHFYL